MPKYILDMISEKRDFRNKLRKSKDPLLKLKFYQISNQVRTAIREYKERKWNLLLDKFGPNPVSTSPFWSIINRARNPKQTPSIPTLRRGDREFKSEPEQVELFASILRLSQTSGLIENLIKNLKIKCPSQLIATNLTMTLWNSRHLLVIQKALEKLKTNSSPGADQIHICWWSIYHLRIQETRTNSVNHEEISREPCSMTLQMEIEN